MRTVFAALALAAMASPAAAADNEMVPGSPRAERRRTSEQLAAYREGEHDSCTWDVPSSPK